MLVRNLLTLATALLIACLIAGCKHARPCPSDFARGETSDGKQMDRPGGISVVDGNGDLLEQWVETALATNPTESMDVLALSGGGLLGAYGAGFMNGWSEKGRPGFRIVTGISSGAMQSVFAFLGKDYDEVLRRNYRGKVRNDIFSNRPVLLVPFSNSFTKLTGLKKLIKESVTETVIQEVAAESKKGRLLLIGTANLDVGRLQIWNLTKLAEKIEAGEPGADIERFRKLLLAAGSVPLAAPPVFIDGYMHVDGGVRAQIFMESILDTAARIRANQPPANTAEDGNRPVLYAIANAYIGLQEEDCIDNSLIAIGERTILSILDANMAGDMRSLQRVAEDGGYDFRFTRVPDDFDAEHKFSKPGDATRLFDLGYKAGRMLEWETELPETAAHVER